MTPEQLNELFSETKPSNLFRLCAYSQNQTDTRQFTNEIHFIEKLAKLATKEAQWPESGPIGTMYKRSTPTD